MDEAPATESLTFEGAVKELESLVETLEQGDSALQQLVERYERGVQLLRHSQQLLDAAELRVAQLDGAAEAAETAPEV